RGVGGGGGPLPAGGGGGGAGGGPGGGGGGAGGRRAGAAAADRAAAPPAAAPPAPASGPAAYNVLGMSWSGAVALDVCALVCEGGRVLSEDHFVFFNNPRTPDGSVRSGAHTAPDKAAVEVDFDGLPAHADRLVLVAAIDPEVDPDADLAGFADARIRLLDSAGQELDQLEVSDGRAGETALVLGSFRRRPGGDWKFVIGGKGYRGGAGAVARPRPTGRRTRTGP
ncbi:TerD family protein, partial [Streptomyces sp. NPDC054838]